MLESAWGLGAEEITIEEHVLTLGFSPSRPSYLVPGRQAAPSFVPCDLGMGLPWHHAFQVHSLPFSEMGGGGLYIDGLGQSRGCWHRGGGTGKALGVRTRT